MNRASAYPAPEGERQGINGESMRKGDAAATDYCRSGITPLMHARTPPRNRLAKVLPEEWRTYLLSNGVPKRKYTAVCRATLTDGRIIEELIIEEGWIVALSKAHLAGVFEERINFDPRTLAELQIIQVA